MNRAMQVMMQAIDLDLQATIRGIDWSVAVAEHFENFSEMRRYVVDPFVLDPYPIKGAQERARSLLLDWLSPEQKKQFEADNHFDVVGVDSGKIYRIRWGCVPHASARCARMRTASCR